MVATIFLTVHPDKLSCANLVVHHVVFNFPMKQDAVLGSVVLVDKVPVQFLQALLLLVDPAQQAVLLQEAIIHFAQMVKLCVIQELRSVHHRVQFLTVDQIMVLQMSLQDQVALHNQ